MGYGFFYAFLKTPENNLRHLRIKNLPSRLRAAAFVANSALLADSSASSAMLTKASAVACRAYHKPTET
jgi:hypothetical protein